MPTAGTVIAISGVIATVELTVVVVLGILVHGKRRLPGLTRSGGLRLHRFGRPGVLIEEVRAAGLTGRGGVSFPACRKMAAVAAQPGPAVVVGNGAEGEPASDKDKTLLRQAPHLVLDGLQLAAEAVRAGRAVLYVSRGSDLTQFLSQEIAQRRAGQLDQVPAELAAGPPRFLAGEETALVSVISGGSALPTFTPPRVFERGVQRHPNLVLNVETLAHLALIARHGVRLHQQGDCSASTGEPFLPVPATPAAESDWR